ncbi:MAG: hypothetical protein LCI03_18725 [Actinobacteria bacterium]|nr:hypothetical protein [Actinomycetota bacterium]
MAAPTMRAGRRAQAGPHVVVVDSYTWQGLADLAGGLRSRGVGVSRITGHPTSARARLLQWIESWVHGPTVAAVDGGVLTGRSVRIDVDRLEALLPPGTVDIQTQEDILALLIRAGARGVADVRGRVRDGVDPQVLVDKWVQAEVARGAGVPIPRTWEGPDSDEIPVVVKARLGFGGNGVRIVRAAADLPAAYAAVDAADLGRPFVQQLLHPAVHTGGVALAGETLVCTAYDGLPSADDPTGPTRVVVAREDDQAVAISRRFLSAVGYTGFFCFDFVRDDDGALYVIDVNSRVFGSWAALQELGFDLLSAYLYVIGAAPRPVQSRGRYGVAAATLRYPCPDTSSRAAVRAWRRESLDVVRRRRALLGRRWAAAMRVRTEIGAVRALRAAGREPGAASPQSPSSEPLEARR